MRGCEAQIQKLIHLFFFALLGLTSPSSLLLLALSVPTIPGDKLDQTVHVVSSPPSDAGVEKRGTPGDLGITGGCSALFVLADDSSFAGEEVHVLCVVLEHVHTLILN